MAIFSTIFFMVIKYVIINQFIKLILTIIIFYTKVPYSDYPNEGIRRYTFIECGMTAVNLE